MNEEMDNFKTFVKIWVLSLISVFLIIVIALIIKM